MWPQLLETETREGDVHPLAATVTVIRYITPNSPTSTPHLDLEAPEQDLNLISLHNLSSSITVWRLRTYVS